MPTPPPCSWKPAPAPYKNFSYEAVEFSDGNYMVVPMFILSQISAMKAESKDVEAFFN